MTDIAPPTPPTGGDASPPPGGSPPPPLSRPDYWPETAWDSKTNTPNFEAFGQHYGELTSFQKTELDRRAAAEARKPEDIKFDIKLPDTVKVPDGVQLKIDENDPRIPRLRSIAHSYGLPQDAVDALVALDAEQKITALNAENERLATEMKALGEKAKDRISAVESWGKGLVSKGEITNDEFEELRAIGSSAAGVRVLEKLIAKVNGLLPGAATPQPPPAPPPQTKSHADRIWPGGFAPSPQAKAS